MAIRYKLDILKELANHGFSTYRLRKEKLLPEGTIQHIRRGEPINFQSLSSICRMLNCQPADLIEYAEDM